MIERSCSTVSCSAAVLLCARDPFVGHHNSELAARDDVAAIVNAGPDARLRSPLAKRRKQTKTAVLMLAISATAQAATRNGRWSRFNPET